jgi:glutamate synthase domain-containing protein 1
MCGIVGFLDKRAGSGHATGRVVMEMLRALACRGPDSAGVALIGDPDQPASREVDELSRADWFVRIAPADREAVERLNAIGLGQVEGIEVFAQSATLRFRFAPELGISAVEVEEALGAARGVLEVLSLGSRLDLVKRVGSPDGLEASYSVSAWRGPLAIGHTRMSTESRIDLSHSQPFWVHGVPDLATVHNGHVTNYHQLRRLYEQQGVTFYTDNDSEVIGVYLRDRLERGRTLAQALTDSVTDLDGAFTYLVASPEGLGIVRDRFGFKPLMVAETDDFVAAATEEVALRRALPGAFRVTEPPPGRATFYPLAAPALVERG